MTSILNKFKRYHYDNNLTAEMILEVKLKSFWSQLCQKVSSTRMLTYRMIFC